MNLKFQSKFSALALMLLLSTSDAFTQSMGETTSDIQETQKRLSLTAARLDLLEISLDSLKNRLTKLRNDSIFTSLRNDYEVAIKAVTNTYAWFSVDGPIKSLPAKDSVLVLGYDDSTERLIVYSYRNKLVGQTYTTVFESNKELDTYINKKTGTVKRTNSLYSTSGSSASGSTTSRSKTTNSSSRKYYRGPRGGCYYYSSSGKKVYVDRSLCN